MFKKSGKTKEPDSESHANNYAMFLLNLRLRTEGELRNKMEERGYAPAVVARVVEELLEQGLVNDVRFSEVFIRNLLAYKQFGFYMIKKKLIEKRLPMDLIETQLNEHVSVIDEFAVAKRYVLKQGLNVRDNMQYKDRQKIAYKLKTRGFRGEVINKILLGQVPPWG